MRTKKAQISLCIRVDQRLCSLFRQRINENYCIQKFVLLRLNRLVCISPSYIHLKTGFIIIRVICNFEEKIKLKKMPLDIMLC